MVFRQAVLFGGDELLDLDIRHFVHRSRNASRAEVNELQLQAVPNYTPAPYNMAEESRPRRKPYFKYFTKE